MSRDVELPGHCHAPDRTTASSVCGHELPCPRHSDPTYCGVPGSPLAVDPELRAMTKIVAAIEPLDEPARERVLAYFLRRFEPYRGPAPAGWVTVDGVEYPLAELLGRIEHTETRLASSIRRRVELVNETRRQRLQLDALAAELEASEVARRAALASHAAAERELVRLRDQLATAHDVLRANGIEPTP